MSLRVFNALGQMAALFLFSSDAIACAVCFGDPNSKLSHGIFAAIYFLLGVIVSVLVTIAWTAFRWAKRARDLEAQNLHRGL